LEEVEASINSTMRLCNGSGLAVANQLARVDHRLDRMDSHDFRVFADNRGPEQGIDELPTTRRKRRV
jgi:hypothetical protein